MLESPSFASAGALMDSVAVCACASTAANPRNSGRQSRAGSRPRRGLRAAGREPAAARAGEGSKLSGEEAGRRVSERPLADAEDSGREAECLRRRHHEDAGSAIRRSGDPAIRRSGDPAIRRSGDPAIRRSGDPAIRRSGDPAIRRSGDPAIRRSGDPAIRRSGDPAIRRSGDPAIRHYTKGNPLSSCQPIHETIFRTPGDGCKRCAQRADPISSFLEYGHRDLSEPVARPAGAHSAQICRASPVPFTVPYAEHGTKARQPRVCKVSAHLHPHTTTAMPLPVSAATEPPTAAPIPCMMKQAPAPSPALTALRA